MSHMKQIITQHLQILLDLTTDLANTLDEKQYSSKLGNLPSNTLGEQLWCVIGTRESYLSSLRTHKWNGWNCTVKEPNNKLQIMQALFHSATELLVWLDKHDPDPKETKVLLKLIEHEAQHHGQLIRYVYGNKWIFPDSWSKYYTV